MKYKVEITKAKAAPETETVEIELPFFSKDKTAKKWFCIKEPGFIHVLRYYITEGMTMVSSESYRNYHHPISEAVRSEPCKPEEFFYVLGLVQDYQEKIHFENSFKKLDETKMNIKVDLDNDQS